jgi:DNA-binding NarL/FixJ family response regulator
MNPSQPRIKVLLAEDHMIVRQGLCTLLKADGHFEIVGEARNGREAVELARTLRPDVILMDIAMPALNGMEATRQILAADPAARILILSAHSDDVYVERMQQAGAIGFLEKQTSAEVLAKAICSVAAGHPYLSPDQGRRQPPHLP